LKIQTHKANTFGNTTKFNEKPQKLKTLTFFLGYHPVVYGVFACCKPSKFL